MDASRVDAAEWERWGADCLLAQDFPDEDARCLARSLAQTSLWGIDSHGIARLPHYLNRVAHGSILARPQIGIKHTGPATAQVHGGQGQGIVVAHKANALAIELAGAAGVSAVGVSDSSHCGAIGLYSRAAARQGYIGIAFTHSDSIAAPFGGREPFFGTNPISLAFPCADADPLCLDMATTAIPWNRVMNARRDGVALPPGVALDAQGQDCTDAQAARALRPLGGEEYGYKGYGLAMMVELLCGPLNGNPFGPHISSMYEALDRPRELGAFFIVIDPARFAGGAALAAVVAGMARELSQAPGSPRMPGGPEAAAQAERLQHGLPVPPALWAEMQDWSGRLGVALPRTR
ncbi:Ldh family oxidoreductase [Achromobacter arsenitoxydans]|uniref:Malate/L-lactate dehydrogenase n=1 Tax=Achromobacter arsenitoxydans SY8 TaxID=477184 RepID=H0F8N3_9BURK|nr:Ldh family oxidoreductase [Achromobacter arsenitoxydans]EHK65347.1 malate/L-lactate dehydrogenase [Achromobacter arsenitoxydans SY8]